MTKSQSSILWYPKNWNLLCFRSKYGNHSKKNGSTSFFSPRFLLYVYIETSKFLGSLERNFYQICEKKPSRKKVFTLKDNPPLSLNVMPKRPETVKRYQLKLTIELSQIIFYWTLSYFGPGSPTPSSIDDYIKLYCR